MFVCLIVILEGCWHARERRARLASDPIRLLDPPQPWIGVRAGCGVLGLGLLFLVCYQLVLPFGAMPGGYRMATVLRFAAAAGCACAILSLVRGCWSAGLADIALGLLTVSVCALATVFVPAEPRELGQRYLSAFNAIVFALSFMTWFWSWLAEVWHQQLDESLPPGQGPGWTTAGRLVPVSRRFSLVASVGGVMVAGLMAVWPALPTVAVDDDSLGRMAAGVSAHLLLILVLMRCGRRTGRSVFRLLSLPAALSMMAFVVIRVRPYMS